MPEFLLRPTSDPEARTPPKPNPDPRPALLLRPGPDPEARTPPRPSPAPEPRTPPSLKSRAMFLRGRDSGTASTQRYSALRLPSSAAPPPAAAAMAPTLCHGNGPAGQAGSTTLGCLVMGGLGAEGGEAEGAGRYCGLSGENASNGDRGASSDGGELEEAEAIWGAVPGEGGGRVGHRGTSSLPPPGPH